MRSRFFRGVSPRLFFVGACFAAGAMAAPAHAQSAPAPAVEDHEQQRTALYREGVALAEAGQWAEALKKFQAVVAIRSAPAALVAMATAQEKLGMLASARRTYSRAHDEARAIGDQALAEKAASKYAAIQLRVPRLAIHISGRSPSDAVVTVDGDRVELSTGGEVEVDPGEHRVAVTVVGERPFEQRVQVAEGQRQELSVDVAPTPPVATAKSSGPPLGPLILGGAGIVTAGVAAIVYANARSTYDEGADCKSLSCADKIKSANDVRGTVLASSIVVGTGVAAVGGAALWWVLSAHAHGSDSRGAASATRVSVAPTPGGYWVQLERAF